MVDPRDPGTIAMPLEVRRRRGRPRKPDALTPAERAARYRARKREREASMHGGGLDMAAFALWESERQALIAENRKLRNDLVVTKSVLAEVRAELRRAARRMRTR